MHPSDLVPPEYTPHVIMAFDLVGAIIDIVHGSVYYIYGAMYIDAVSKYMLAKALSDRCVIF